MEHAGNQLFASLEELADSRYTEIFELLHMGIALLSDQGVFLYANRAFMELFGFAEDIRGHHVSQLFLTSEQGVMEAIRTREMTVCSSITANNSQGVSFRYPLLDAGGDLLGIIIEAVPTNIDRDKLGNLLSTIKNLEEKANYLEHKWNPDAAASTPRTLPSRPPRRCPPAHSANKNAAARQTAPSAQDRPLPLLLYPVFTSQKGV